jgi:hypothetical protein
MLIFQLGLTGLRDNFYMFLFIQSSSCLSFPEKISLSEIYILNQTFFVKGVNL